MVSEWWTAIEGWEPVDLECLSDSPYKKGSVFVSKTNGIYFVAATVRVRLLSTADDRYVYIGYL